MIRIATGLELPSDVVTQAIAILARRGAGKTYTGSAAGGTFSDYLSSLRRNGLIDESTGVIRAGEALFLGDR